MNSIICYLFAIAISSAFATSRHSGTMVDFTDPKITIASKKARTKGHSKIKLRSAIPLGLKWMSMGSDVTGFQVQGHLDALVRMAQSCVIKVKASPKDVRAYFTNSSPVTRPGQCFAACMLEQSDVISHGKVNRELLVHLASLVNGKNSRVVRKLSGISRLCLDSIEGMSDRCQLASTYNDCLNENMLEFSFPLDIAEEVVRKMPFHLIQPNLPSELRHVHQ